MENQNVGAVKFVGYLEKKGKMKVVTTWKKYWFVLEGRLLLYYRSQEEYLKLSPCKGSINISPVTDIRPGLAAVGVFQIITRANTITLRAKGRGIQEKWLQALLDATGQQSTSPVKMSHFRYSMDDLTPNTGKKNLVRQNTLPNRFMNKVQRRNTIIDRIRQIGGHNYMGSLDALNQVPKNDARLKIYTNESSDQVMNQNREECFSDEDSASEIILRNDIYLTNVQDQILTPSTENGQENKDNELVVTNELYAIVQDSKNKPNTQSKENTNNTKIRSPCKENDIILNNDLYASVNKIEENTGNKKNIKEMVNGIMVDNSEYVVLDNHLKNDEYLDDDFDHNKNCVIENDQYLKSEVILQNTEETRNVCEKDNDLYIKSVNLLQNDKVNSYDAEYYCTYEELQSTSTLSNSHIYQPVEPVLPPRREERISESEDAFSQSSKEDSSKITRLQRFALKFTKKSAKNNTKSFKQKSAGLIKRVMGKKKSPESDQLEPIYDVVDYVDPETTAVTPDQAALIRTLTELQLKLQVRRSQIKQEILKSSSTASSPISDKKSTHFTNSTNEVEYTKPVEDTPGLPPRRGSKMQSDISLHDAPQNNILLSSESLNLEEQTEQSGYSIDKILHDLKNMETKQCSNKMTPIEELSVKQLIKKFNHKSEDGNCSAIDTCDVSLRQKCNGETSHETLHAMVNRHSDELNKLLEELTKVTCAPLLIPGATSSLVQMKSDGLTDDEWLAIHPIRRSRHSEPDYDVPRPHRSLQILPRSPDKDDEGGDMVITATRFFGPGLPPNTDTSKKSVEQSLQWRTMTPDSLEPLQSYLATVKYQNKTNGNIDVERNRTVGYDNINNNLVEELNWERNLLKDAIKNRNTTIDDLNEYQQLKNLEKNKPNDNFLDSLEPFVEVSTEF